MGKHIRQYENLHLQCNDSFGFVQSVGPNVETIDDVSQVTKSHNSASVTEGKLHTSQLAGLGYMFVTKGIRITPLGPSLRIITTRDASATAPLLRPRKASRSPLPFSR